MTARHRSQAQYEEAPAPRMNREPRRGVRFDARVTRTIEWEDTNGCGHTTEAITRIVGAYGCKLMMPQALPLGQRITIVDSTRHSTVTGTIVWKGKERADGCEMGVELVSPNMDFWVKEPQLSPGEERRRGQRAILRLPVTLHYSPRNLAHQAVQAHTMTVNDHGAVVLCNREFSTGSELELESRQLGKKISCRVKRQPKETPDGYQLALEFAQPALNFWPVSFPPPQ